MVNNAMIRIKKKGVDSSQEYTAHISKLRLAKKMRVKHIIPIFKFPRLSKKIMERLEEELSLIELPCKPQNDVINKFYDDHIDQASEQQDNNSSVLISKRSSNLSSTRSRENTPKSSNNDHEEHIQTEES